MQTMQAAVFRRYGPPEVVSVATVDRPVPQPGEVLIRTRAATVTTGDWRIRSLDVPPGFGLMVRAFFGIFRPRQPILGTELASVIEAIGADVTTWQVGDEVVAATGTALGAHAEYRTMAAAGALARKPSQLDFPGASALSFGGNTALVFLRDMAKLQAGEKVLVIGASGAVGSAAVQLAKHLGAHVTGVTSTANRDFVLAQGADAVIDYTREDFRSNGQRYDVIFDTVGSGATLTNCRSSLTDQGRLLLAVAGIGEMLASLKQPANGPRLLTGNAETTRENLTLLAELAEAGRFRPHIEKVYPLAEVVEAHRRVESGRKRGSVVLQLG